MEAYLDNSATTIVSPEVVEVMTEAMQVEYGNPSSMHTYGLVAERNIKAAKEVIARSLKVQEKEIFFTSGGTESNNLAIVGTAMANKRAGNHIITSAIEHASVLATMKYLEEQGFRITYIPVDENGIILLDKLEEAIQEDTILVSLMYVNNEIGAVEPIEEVAQLIKRKNKKTLFHVDAIQAFGKYRIRPKKLGIDLLSVSGHKIHGPKGIGFLYVNEKVKIQPIIFGGGQQNGLRSGTENVPGIIGLAKAVQLSDENLKKHVENLYECKEAFVNGVQSIEGAQVNGKTGRDSAPHIVSVSFDGIRSEVLLHSLEERNIYVSAGSACASNKPAVSATLKGIHLDQSLLDATIRFSFGAYTTLDEIDYAIDSLRAILPVLRKYRRK
ncbi:MAG: cysteine desulfurase family protein [Lachnospiraceae bacterium]